MKNLVKGSTPDLTPAQIVAAVGAVAAQLVNATLIDGKTEHLIDGIAGIVIPIAIVAADAIIRWARNQRHAATATAEAKTAELNAALAASRGERIETAMAKVGRTLVTTPQGEPVSVLLSEREPRNDANAAWEELSIPDLPPFQHRLSETLKRQTGHPALKIHGTFEGLPLGKLPAEHDPRTVQLASYLTSKPSLGARLARSVRQIDPLAAILGGDFGMFGNDQYGDCTCASLGHAVEFWTGYPGGQPLVRPTAGQVLDLYWQTGKSDTGRVMFEVLKHALHNGLYGREIEAYASVGIHRWKHRDIKAAIDLFGGCYLGVALPVSAQTQATWDVVGDPSAGGPAEWGSWGGHAIWLADYDQTGPTCITWAHPHKMTWAFIDAYADEAYAIIAKDWLDEQGGKTIEGFDLALLRADLDKIRQGWQPPQ